MTATRAAPLLAIFVGGAATRMGGRPKGLLRAPDGRSIVERWRDLATQLDLRAVLVGDARAYAHLEMAGVGDEVAGAGPLAGLGITSPVVTPEQAVSLPSTLIPGG